MSGDLTPEETAWVRLLKTRLGVLAWFWGWFWKALMGAGASLIMYYQLMEKMA